VKEVRQFQEKEPRNQSLIFLNSNKKWGGERKTSEEVGRRDYK